MSVRVETGHEGTAVITTRTTVTPVTVTEVKNGTVMQRWFGIIVEQTTGSRCSPGGT